MNQLYLANDIDSTQTVKVQSQNIFSKLVPPAQNSRQIVFKTKPTPSNPLADLKNLMSSANKEIEEKRKNKITEDMERRKKEQTEDIEKLKVMLGLPP